MNKKDKKPVFLRIVQMMEEGRFATREVDLFLSGLIRGLMMANIGKGLRFETDLDFIKAFESQKANWKFQMSGPRVTGLRNGYWLITNTEGYKITRAVFRKLCLSFGIEDRVAQSEWDRFFSRKDEEGSQEEPALSPDAEPEQEALSMRSEKEVAQLEERADRAEKKAEELDQKLEAVISKLDEILKRRPYQTI